MSGGAIDQSHPREPAPASTRVRRVAVLGRRGDCIVWRGWWDAPGEALRPVAIKTLLAERLGDADARARLRDEGRYLSLVSHPNVVRVVDCVVLDGAPAVVMELLDGADVRARLRAGSLPRRVGIEVVAAAARGLAALHAARDPRTGRSLRLVHRDVKPGNVHVTRAGRVVLLDLGAARGDVAQREARSGSFVLGTMGYLAPERMRGTSTSASDVWALGALLYEVLTGELLRLGSGGTLRAVTGLDALDPMLARVAGCAMARDPALRMTAAGVARVLSARAKETPGPRLEEWAPGPDGIDLARADSDTCKIGHSRPTLRWTLP